MSLFWKVVVGAALVAIAAVVVISFGDIKRYIRIRTM